MSTQTALTSATSDFAVQRTSASAATHGTTAFIVVSKDNDFRQRSFLRRAPPKLVWLSVGNAGTTRTADLLRREHGRLLALESEAETALLAVPLFGAF